WDDTGGPGRVCVAPQGILVVDQTAQWHEEVAATLALLREAVNAEEDEVAELPDAGRPNQAQRQPLQRAIYHVGHFAADDVVEAIRGTVAPETWKGAGGEGAIHIVRPEAPAAPANAIAPQAAGLNAPAPPPAEQPPAAPAAPAAAAPPAAQPAPAPPPPPVLLVVYQTRDVHREVARLLQALGIQQPPGAGGMVGGGVMGGGGF
ncbi:MAG TPA: hypothetical protein VGX76_16395, partial [Pirellulales bacterium]|nr:hypothetical protein [Pirellulales bacterium]